LSFGIILAAVDLDRHFPESLFFNCTHYIMLQGWISRVLTA
jgi:glutamate racemase